MEPQLAAPRSAVVLAALVALSTLTAILPAAAQGTEAGVEDDAGDVALALGPYRDPLPPPTPLPVPLAGLDPLTGPLDLTAVKVYGETATHLSFGYQVVSFARLNTLQPASLVHRICFEWDGSGGDYQFIANFAYDTTSVGVEAPPVFQGAALERLSGPCDPFDTGTYPDNPRAPHHLFVVRYDPAAGTFDVDVTRQLIRTLTPDAEQGGLDPPMTAGDKLVGVRAFTIARAGINNVYYDETTPFDYTLGLDTGNELVKVIVANNILGSFSLGLSDTPRYGVEIGSFQTVPVTIENHLDVAIEPNITVTLLAGDAASWQVRTIPSIPVPAKVGDEPGRETVTLIVNSAPTVVHKDAVRLLVSALDPSHPADLGAALVDLVAVVPPTVDRATLYFHGSGRPCNTDERWLNTLATDASGAGSELGFQGCDPQGSDNRLTTTGEISRVFRPDVPFARDYVLGTGPVDAVIGLRSLVRIPGETPIDVPVPTVADVKVQLYSGDDLIGEGALTEVDLTGDMTLFTVPVYVRGGILGDPERKVPNDRPLNVVVSVATDVRTFDVGGFCVAPDVCVPEKALDVQGASGKIYMALGGVSKIDLPILSSTRAGDQLNITASGALITLRVTDGEPARFTNPGKSVVYDLAVRNQGVNLDTATITATLDDPAWGVEILPATEFRLRVGEARSFEVRVTAPDDAAEGDEVHVTVTATSKVDTEAFQRVPLTVQTTKQQQFEDEDPTAGKKAPKDKDSPGVSAVLLLAAAAGLVALARRRRT